MKKIFYLGPSASYCDLAKNRFKELMFADSAGDVEEVAKPTILSILRELANPENENSFGVVPIENSVEGVVRETLDNLLLLKYTDNDVYKMFFSKQRDYSQVKNEYIKLSETLFNVFIEKIKDTEFEKVMDYWISDEGYGHSLMIHFINLFVDCFGRVVDNFGYLRMCIFFINEIECR